MSTNAARALYGMTLALTTLDVVGEAEPEPVAFDWPAYCFVCGRCTDHFAEHDDLVAAGLVSYDTTTGNVLRTERWDRDLADIIGTVSYQAYASGPAAYEQWCKVLETAFAA